MSAEMILDISWSWIHLHVHPSALESVEAELDRAGKNLGLRTLVLPSYAAKPLVATSCALRQ